MIILDGVPRLPSDVNLTVLKDESNNKLKKVEKYRERKSKEDDISIISNVESDTSMVAMKKYKK